MPLTQNINRTTIPAGTMVFPFVTKTTQPWTTADVIINRTGNPASGPWLNNLTAADTLTLEIQYSTDGGVTWQDIGGGTFVGGMYVTKGITLAVEEMSVGLGQPFPTGSEFQIVATASAPTQISGTITYLTQ